MREVIAVVICEKCGKAILGKVYPGGSCQGCYRYFSEGGTVNPLPNKGEIVRDSRGYVICHICGRAYKRLGSHVKESHGKTISEYKEEFGLCNNAKTTELSYSTRMKDLAYQNGMPERLIITGYKTRIKPGENKLRFGKKSRLQECINKSRRKRGNNK